MTDAVRTEIDVLRKETVKALKTRYRELFGEDSASSNRAHLFHRIAWRLQAASEGDLTARASQRAADLAADVDLRLRAPRKFWGEVGTGASLPSRDRRLPSIGTLVTREYQSRSISAKVLETGFEYEGRKYESLSSIAYEVTGTRWNGFAFFRLKKEPKND